MMVLPVLCQHRRCRPLPNPRCRPHRRRAPAYSPTPAVAAAAAAAAATTAAEATAAASTAAASDRKRKAAADSAKARKRGSFGGNDGYRRAKRSTPVKSAKEKADIHVLAGGRVLLKATNDDPTRAEIRAEVAIARARYTGSTVEEQDGMIREWIVLGLSRWQVMTIFKVGNFRYVRIRDGKPKQQRGGRQDGKKLAPETISYIKLMVKDDAESSKVCMGYKLEPGLPCQHKPMNWYLCDGATLKEVHAAMVAELEANPAEGVRAPSCGDFDIFLIDFLAHRQCRSTPLCPCAAVSLSHVLIGG